MLPEVDAETERNGVAVVRAWTEHGRTSLRIRFTSTADLIGAAETVSLLASRDDACRALGAWLDALVDEVPAQAGRGAPSSR